MLMSDTRLQKYVRGIVSIFTIFVVIAPMPGLISRIPHIDMNIGGEGGININNDFAQRQAIAQYERALERALGAEGWRNVRASIRGSTEGLILRAEQITLDIQNLVIDSQNEHINKYDRLRELTAEFLRVNQAIIIIIG